MSYTMHTDVQASARSYGSTRTASQIKYIVIHYTGNKTDTAAANAKYYKNSNTRSAGAHYFVDGTDVYKSIDDLKVAWAVGGSKYTDCATTGGGTLYKTVTNANSISIELCSTAGAISAATFNNAVQLTQELMTKYNVPAAKVVRHFDVTGKHCPGYTEWIGSNPTQWTEFKSRISGSTTNATTETTATSNGEFKVRVLAASLNIRKGPGTNYDICGKITNKGVYTITKQSGAWGYLKSGAGWINISASYCSRL